MTDIQTDVQTEVYINYAQCRALSGSSQLKFYNFVTVVVLGHYYCGGWGAKVGKGGVLKEHG